jgi:uncharacterized membrane protein (DUF106 family)
MLQKIKQILTIVLLAVLIVCACIFVYQYAADQSQLAEQKVEQEAIAKKRLEAAKALVKRDSEYKSGFKAPWEK